MSIWTITVTSYSRLNIGGNRGNEPGIEALSSKNSIENIMLEFEKHWKERGGICHGYVMWNSMAYRERVLGGRLTHWRLGKVSNGSGYQARGLHYTAGPRDPYLRMDATEAGLRLYNSTWTISQCYRSCLTVLSLYWALGLSARTRKDARLHWRMGD